MKKLLLALAIVPFLLSCTPFGGPIPGVQPPGVYVQHVGVGETQLPYTLDLQSAKSVYFAFNNPEVDSPHTIIEVAGASARTLLPTGPQESAVPASSPIAPTPAEISEYNRSPLKGRWAELKAQRNLSGTAVPPKPLLDTEGSPTGTPPNGWDLGDVGGILTLGATCQKVIPSVDIGGDNRTLNVWVANDCWDGDNDGAADVGPGKAYAVNQAMVDAIAAKFLTSGSFNDIYDWVSSMVGAEWGSYSDPSVIGFSDKSITILLCDIEGDNSPNGGVVGFFWAKDNFRDSYVYNDNPASPYYFPYHSNERIMFYIDAVMFANPAPSTNYADWTPNCYWAEEIYSTLAHEFQHMINFNQKLFVAGADNGTDTWINEMCSQAVEDLVSDKLGVIGPRGVDGSDPTAGSSGNNQGRLPLFNAKPRVSLGDWAASGALESYSATYAFGAYLIRNYGGAALLKAMVQDKAYDQDQIVNAVSAYTGRTETFSTILQRWSAAVLLSDRTDAPPGYVLNTGGYFTSSVGSGTYNLGSINFFNYVQDGSSKLGPDMYSGSGKVGSRPPLATSGTLYLAASDSEGKNNWLINLPDGVTLTVVVK